MTDADLLRQAQALCDADDDPTYDPVKNGRDSYYEAIAAMRQEILREREG